MLKTVSAALLAVAVMVAPALAAGTNKTAQSPATKSASVNTSGKATKNPLNANARISHHHSGHHRHHRLHDKVTMHKVHKSPKVAAKHVMHPAKRG